MTDWPAERILGRGPIDRALAALDRGELPAEAVQLFLAGMLAADERGVITPEAMKRADELAAAGTVVVRPFEEDAAFVRVRFVPHAILNR